MELVSVIIPTFNRFKYLLNTIKSVQNQTYNNIEIIVINDCSTQKDYYEHDWNDIKIIHLKQNTKEIFGYPCAGYVRNQGIINSNGNYIAFCDDDDIWFPKKIELQIEAMIISRCKLSSTDGLNGCGPYDSDKLYKKHNAEIYYNAYKGAYGDLFCNGFPKIITLNFLQKSNCIICSSVVIKKEILDKINNMKNIKNGKEDYTCWLDALKLTDCVYVNECLIYYDNNHGNGRNYD